MNTFALAAAAVCFAVAMAFAFKAGRIGPVVESKPSRMDSKKVVDVPRNRWYFMGATLATLGFILAGWWAQEDPAARLLGMRMLVLVPCVAALIPLAGFTGRRLFRRSRRAIAREAQMYQRVETHVRKTLR